MVNRMLLQTGSTLTILGAVALFGTSTLQAQVGVSSGVAQVALVVRAAPRVSLPAAATTREIASTGAVREALVGLSVTANSAYRLVVRGMSSRSNSRVWVRAIDGRYQEVVSGSSATVLRSAHSAGGQQREVSYRMEAQAGEDLAELPVRYEIVVEPTL